MGDVLDRLVASYHAALRRLRRIERRELREFRAWLEHTNNLLHLSVLFFVPVLIGVVTWLSATNPLVSFLIFPPLASGTFTLFSDPEGRYSSPAVFVGGTTAGAACGWVAVEVVRYLGDPAATGTFGVSAGGAALAVFLTGVVTWGLDLEEPTAYSTALLILLIGGRQLEYLLGVALSSGLVAAVFVVWRNRFYERRARYLYRTTSGDDHVLVPMRAEAAAMEPTVAFASTVAADHRSGKVVLLDVVDDADAARAERALIEREGQEGELVGTTPDGGQEPEGGSVREEAEQRAVAEHAIELEEMAEEVGRRHDVPCEVVVAVAEGGWSPRIVEDTLEETGCDLVVTRYEGEGRKLSSFLSGLFSLDHDVVAFRSSEGKRSWYRAMVPVRTASDNARAMVDFARRVTCNTFDAGRVSVCHCIERERERRSAETMLANLVDAFPGDFETRVARSDIETFLETNAPGYDLVMVGASTDRTAASRFVAPPTFTKLDDVEADVAVVHRGR
jgi:nucleotide-binding universal stress UspA family protein